jgi:AcrR family transcriptional regulator
MAKAAQKATKARKRLTREEQRERTRAQLMDAGARVFSRQGFGGASVEEVAEEAGFSRGAVYSNFESKEDFFLALLEERMEERLGALREMFRQDKPDGQKLTEAGLFLGEIDARERQWYLLFMEAWAYAVRHSTLKRKLAADYAAIREAVAELLERECAAADVRLPAPAETIATAVVAMSDGFVIQALLDPERFPSDSYASMLALFVRGMEALGEVQDPQSK